VKAGIINVTGYGGAELARILSRHPELDVVSVTGRSSAGKRLAEVFPHLSDADLPITEELDADTDTDIVFSALPHAASAERLLPLIGSGTKIVDFSADFRLKDAAVYRQWYKVDHPSPAHLEKAVYGLPELNRDEIRESSLVANPGCYPTAAILAMAPAVKGALITEDVIVDAKSGVSGAGRALSLNTHYAETNESVKAYSVGGHRHMPEITQELGRINPGPELRLTFMTHLIPMTRGILVTGYAPLNTAVTGTGEKAATRVRAAYEDYYRDEPFVSVVDEPPATKHTLGANSCLVYPTVDVRTDRLIVIACIDNLVKGAAGAAVQSANIMLGLPETAGLQQLALYP
jgi:N-acetyl-gamma-glutamyl-phosphate reductase